MWICSECEEQHQDDFTSCWKCGTSREGEFDPEFTRELANTLEMTSQTEEYDPHSMQYQLRDIFNLTTAVAVILGIAFSSIGQLVFALLLILVSLAIIGLLTLFAIWFVVSCLLYLIFPHQRNQSNDRRLPFDVWVARQRLMQNSAIEDAAT